MKGKGGFTLNLLWI